MNAEQQRIWDEAWDMATKCQEQIIPVVEWRERVAAMRFLHTLFTNISKQVENEELPLAGVPAALRESIRHCQESLESMEGQLLAAETSLELYHADLGRHVPASGAGS